MLTPAPSDAAKPTKKAFSGLPVRPAAAKIGARVETAPSIRPRSLAGTRFALAVPAFRRQDVLTWQNEQSQIVCKSSAGIARPDGRRGLDPGADFAAAGLTGKTAKCLLRRLGGVARRRRQHGPCRGAVDDGTVTGPAVRSSGAPSPAWRPPSRDAAYLSVPDTQFGVALKIAYAVVAAELIAIAFIRWRFMSGNLWATIAQVIVGGGIVFGIGIWLGQIGAG